MPPEAPLLRLKGLIFQRLLKIIMKITNFPSFSYSESAKNEALRAQCPRIAH